jgi:hypothetical protein
MFRKELTCRSATIDAHCRRGERIGSFLRILGETNHTRRVEGVRDLLEIMRENEKEFVLESICQEKIRKYYCGSGMFFRSVIIRRC